MPDRTERKAAVPQPVNPRGFNKYAVLPYGLTIKHVASATGSFSEFLGYVDRELARRDIARLESMLMPANFSSIVGEFIVSSIPKFCTTLVKNRYHNGYPDLLPAGIYLRDAAQHSEEGIEVKASRYMRGWQGHNPEDTWLLVFVFDSNRPSDTVPRPFRFVQVAGARLSRADWMFAGRREGSRRTITASVTPSGYQKIMGNWIYRDPPILES